MPAFAVDGRVCGGEIDVEGGIEVERFWADWFSGGAGAVEGAEGVIVGG